MSSSPAVRHYKYSQTEQTSVLALPGREGLDSCLCLRIIWDSDQYFLVNGMGDSENILNNYCISVENILFIWYMSREEKKALKG